MRRVTRLAFAAVIFATGPLVAACDSLDSFELFDTKKKLAGERKPVFPEGVPGATSGIPAELVRGYREPEHADVTDPARVAAEAAAAEAAKPKPRPAPAPAAAKPSAPSAAAKPSAQSAAAKPPKPSSTTAQSSATASSAAPAGASAAPGQPGGPPLPWPGAPQPQAAWPGTAGTVAR